MQSPQIQDSQLAGLRKPAAAVEGRILRVPHPYRAMLAICSDLDETPDRSVYWNIARFLNTTDDTSMGPGVGLEVGNTIYFDMPPDQFAYWNTDDAGRDMIHAMIRSGHIDSLHSFGDLATTRKDAMRSLEALDRHGCRLSVWIDHSKTVTNFDPDIMYGKGDLPEAAAYHADLTIAHGVRWVWRGRITSVIGQDISPSVRGIFSARNPWASARTLAKEAAKHCIARRGNAKYAMHPENRLMRTVKLRDGQPVYEFLRCNPYWGGVGEGATAAGLAEVLTDRFLDRLIERKGLCMLYTHLGKVRDAERPFDERTCDALRRLARRFRDKGILVTTTARMLNYVTVRDNLRWSVTRAGDRALINIEAVDEPSPLSARELGGITFAIRHNGPVEVRLKNEEAIKSKCERKNGETIVSIPLAPLAFPALDG